MPVLPLSKETLKKTTETATRVDQYKKVFLKILHNSQENTCARVSFLKKLQAEACVFIKKRLWHRCFRVNFTKFLRTPFLQNTSERLLLKLESSKCNIFALS